MGSFCGATSGENHPHPDPPLEREGVFLQCSFITEQCCLLLIIPTAYHSEKANAGPPHEVSHCFNNSIKENLSHPIVKLAAAHQVEMKVKDDLAALLAGVDDHPVARLIDPL